MSFIPSPKKECESKLFVETFNSNFLSHPSGPGEGGGAKKELSEIMLCSPGLPHRNMRERRMNNGVMKNEFPRDDGEN